MTTKDFLKKSVVPISSAIVGGLIVFAVLKLNTKTSLKSTEQNVSSEPQGEQVYDDIFKQQENIHRQFDSLFNGEKNDPFDEMKKMRQQMQKHMQALSNGNLESANNPFDSWYSNRFGGGTLEDISKKEDDDFVYYEIKVDDINSTSINTKVEGRYINITGTTEKKSGSTDDKDNSYSSQSVFKSSFSRKFPLPENVDANKMQMTNEKDKIILKFPKTKK